MAVADTPAHGGGGHGTRGLNADDADGAMGPPVGSGSKPRAEGRNSPELTWVKLVARSLDVVLEVTSSMLMQLPAEFRNVTTESAADSVREEREEAVWAVNWIEAAVYWLAQQLDELMTNTAALGDKDVTVSGQQLADDLGKIRLQLKSNAVVPGDDYTDEEGGFDYFSGYLSDFMLHGGAMRSLHTSRQPKPGRPGKTASGGMIGLSACQLFVGVVSGQELLAQLQGYSATVVSRLGGEVQRTLRSMQPL